MRKDDITISSPNAHMERTMRSATAPHFPSNVLAEYAAARLAEISAVVAISGYVGKRL